MLFLENTATYLITSSNLFFFSSPSGSEMTQRLFYFTKQTDPGSMQPLEVRSPGISKPITGIWG